MNSTINISFNCVMVDFEDVVSQINNILIHSHFELAEYNLFHTSSVRYHHNGLVISLVNVQDANLTTQTVTRKLELFGWLDSVINITIEDHVINNTPYSGKDILNNEYKLIAFDSSLSESNQQLQFNMSVN